MKEVTINLDNFDLENGNYVTVAIDRDGNKGVLVFIP